MTDITNVSFDPSIMPIELKPKNTEYKQALENSSLMGSAMTTMADIMLLFTELSNAKFNQMTQKTDVSRDAQDMANRVDRAIAELEKADSKAELPEDVIKYMRDNNILVEGKTIDEFLSESKPGLQDAIDKLKTGLEGGAGMTNKEFLEIMGYMNDNKLSMKDLNIDPAFWIGAYDKPNAMATPENMQKLLNVLEGDGTQLDKGDMTAVKAALESASGRASDFVQQSQLKLQQLMQNFNTAVTMANSIQSMNAESTKSIAQSIR